jgi:hypothetical protein
MSYLDNDFNADDSHREDEDENLDDKVSLTEEEIVELSIDENYKIISDMYENLNDYINSKDYIFPIIQFLNRDNFDNWFSQFIRPANFNNLKIGNKTKNNKLHKLHKNNKIKN